MIGHSVALGVVALVVAWLWTMVQHPLVGIQIALALFLGASLLGLYLLVRSLVDDL